MPSRLKGKKRTRKVAFKGPSGQMAPPDAAIRVAITSLEAQVGYRSLLRQLQKAFILRLAFFRSKEGGGLTLEEARAQACEACEDEEEARAIVAELMSHPVENIRFIDLARLWGVGQGLAETLWEMIKTSGRDVFEIGHLATDNLTPAQYQRTAWAVASYLGLRESFAAEWQPQGGIQLSLIDNPSIPMCENQTPRND